MPRSGALTRLDTALVRRGLATTRSQASDLVRRGAVCVGGIIATKPGATVTGEEEIVVEQGVAGWVSRGALKLLAGLDAFGFDPRGLVALDLGASTGGFTQVLLARGAVRVYAVDVGHGQLHPTLAADAAVVSLEGQDARALTPMLIPGPIGAIAADVSFISLTKALRPALELACPDCWLVALVKPQFEAGREAVGKGGIVRSEEDRLRALACVRDWIGRQRGWRVAGAVPSPITGRSGNVEFLLGAVREA